MITLMAQMDDGSFVNAIYNDDTAFTYSSEFELPGDDYRFPGATFTQATPLAYASIEGTEIVFRQGASYDPPFPYGQDLQVFKMDLQTRQGQECFTEDNSTITNCRSIVSADLTTTVPSVHQVPIPGWVGVVTFALLVGIAISVVKTRVKNI